MLLRYIHGAFIQPQPANLGSLRNKKTHYSRPHPSRLLMRPANSVSLPSTGSVRTGFSAVVVVSLSNYEQPHTHYLVVGSVRDPVFLMPLC